jgi:hypothetical protein
VAGECALKSAVSKMKGTRCGVGLLGKRKVVGQLFGSAPCAQRRARQHRPSGWRRLGRSKKMTPEGGLGRSGRVGQMPLGSAQRENKKREMGRKDDWAEIILGCVEGRTTGYGKHPRASRSLYWNLSLST